MGDAGLTHWSNPVTQAWPDWVEEIIPYYEQIVMLVYPYTQDPIGARDWQEAKKLLDVVPEPDTVDAANLRWRQFVASVWWLIEKAKVRYNQQAAARRR